MDHDPAAPPLPWSDLLALRPMAAIPPQARTVWLWGPAAVHAVALRSAARAVAFGRAFTCWQFTTLLCERLEPLLAAHPIGLILLLDPLTHFYDQDVTFKEATFLFQRVLQTLSTVPRHWPHVLIAQVVPPVGTPRRLFARDLLRVVDVGLRLQAG